MTKLIDSPRRVLAGLAVLFVLAVAAGAHALAERGVAPAPASAPSGEFSAERAMVHLARFAREPRPVGSEANERTEDYLGEENEATVRAAYQGPTWDRLRKLKRRYDPDNLFHLNHNIPPADG